MSGNGQHGGPRDAILAIDTATSQVVVALSSPSGEPLGVRSWPAGHRHGEGLLPSIVRLLDETSVPRSELRGIVVGTGPGAFTGLRVGIATAKGLAHGLGLPIAGVATSDALIAAAAATEGTPEIRIVLLLPAGSSDRVVVRRGLPPRLVPGGEEPEIGPNDLVVAVDLDGRARVDALERGDRARDALGRELLRLGAARLAAGDPDDLAELVPEYVTLPRGVAVAAGEVAWSPAPR